MGDDDSDYRVERVELGEGRAALRFAGELRFRQCFASWAEVRRLAQEPGRYVALDLSAIDHLDGAATALLLELRAELGRGGVTSEIVGAQGSVRAMLELYGAHP